MKSGRCIESKRRFGACSLKVYGRALFKGKRVLAYRLAYQAVYGEIPHGMNVLHRCDNERCCNPEHLYLGTNRDNVLDFVKRHLDDFIMRLAQKRFI